MTLDEIIAEARRLQAAARKERALTAAAYGLEQPTTRHAGGFVPGKKGNYGNCANNSITRTSRRRKRL